MRTLILLAAEALLLLSQPDAVRAQATDPIKGERIVTFLSHRTGANLLYVMKPDGSDIRPIFGGPIEDVPSFTEGVTLLREPHWTRQSPNGKYFASWVYEKGIPYSKYQGALRPMLWVGGINGKWSRIVNPDCTEEFAWSPDSKKIAFSILSRDHNRGFLRAKLDSTEICVSGADGSDSNYVLEQEGRWTVQDWSPDGQHLLLLRRRFGISSERPTADLFRFRLNEALSARRNENASPLRGSEWAAKSSEQYLDKLPHDLAGLTVDDARYSPDGKLLALCAHDPAHPFAPNLVADDELSRGRMSRLLGKIAVLDLSKGSSKVIADYDDGIRGPICWSHDGTEILFSRYLPKDDDREKFRANKEHGLAIWAISRDGSKARFITTGWSPDCGRDLSHH